ncbi:MAG: acyltransferase [Sinimarinibacterium sp.]|jgi:peptidoglycan/LPS O-acetylase OafA/YrhL
MNRPENIPALTGLRAYAACWVMVLHLQHGIGIKHNVDFGAFIERGGWAVDIFFVLSGFILSMLYSREFESRIDLRTWARYLSARLARIYPLHAFGLLVLGLYYFGTRLGGTPLPPGFSLGNFALNVSLLHGWGLADRLSWNYPSWSIGTEWFAYLVMLPLLARALRRLPAWGVLLLGLAAWTIVFLLVHRTGQTIGFQSVKWGIPRIAAEFLLGYGLHRIWQFHRPAGARADALMAGGLTTIVALAFAPAAFEWLLGPAICALLLGLTGRGRFGQALFASRAAVFWGERSYSIYMVHAVVQIYCNLAIQRLGWAEFTPVQSWMLLALQVCAVLALSHFTYGRIEVPARQWVRRRFETAVATDGTEAKHVRPQVDVA